MSSLVTITIDNDRLLDTPKGAILVEKVADYPQACFAMRKALQSRKRLTIAIRHKVVAIWLAAFAQGYGEDKVAIKKYTARDALAAKWGIPIPNSVSDSDILQSRLLEESVSAREGQNFTDLILEHFYSDILAFRTLPVKQLSALLAKYDAEKWRLASSRPLVQRTLNERFNQWLENTQSSSVREIITALRSNPLGLRRDLNAFQVLKNYPREVGFRVLNEGFDRFQQTHVDTDALEVIAPQNPALTEIEYYLAGIRGEIRSIEDVEILLGQVSGRLDAEFQFIELLLRNNPDWATPSLLRRLEQRFLPMRPRVDSSLASLQKLVKPAFPCEPQLHWSASDWLAWVQNSYMPYYTWLENQNKQDPIVMGYAIAFADWFYENFVALKNGEYEKFSFTALYRETSRIQTPNAVTLALIVDNFNYVHFEELRRIFLSQGMSLASSEPLFSLIPTATEVGKSALIATKGDLIDLPTSSYSALVDKEWNQSGKRATYLANIGALQQLQTLDFDIYFLNYLPIDEVLHQNAQSTGRPHSEIIYEQLATLVKTVSDFAKRFQLQKRLLVYVLSDHGATRISEGAVNVLDASYYKSITDKNHHRYVTVSDEQLEALPQLASQQCYVVDRRKFKTNRNYLAAREYYRFLTTTDSFHVHGGLTPEEVVVPFARFTFTPVIPIAPTLRLNQNEFRYAVKSQIVLEIGNPNGFAIENITLRLIDAISEAIVVDKLLSKETTVVALTTTFRKSIGGGNTRVLGVRCTYLYQGSEYTVPDAEFTITIKSLMEETNDFSDIF